MDVFRDLARLTFQKDTQFEKPSSCKSIRVIKHPTTSKVEAETKSEPEDSPEPDLSESSLDERLRLPDDVQRSIRVVVVPRSEQDFIGLSKEAFTKLFDDFHIDPTLLLHVSHSGYGFHSCDEQYEDCFSFYVGTYVYSMAWSYDPRTMKTSAIMLLRTNKILEEGTRAYDSLKHVLDMYKTHLDTPMLLLFVVYIQLCTMSQAAIALNVRFLREIERFTGHGPSSNPQTAPSDTSKYPEIDDLAKYAGNVATIQTHVANLLRHEPYLKDISSALCDDKLRAKWLSERPNPRAEEAFTNMQKLLPQLGKMTSDLGSSLVYLQTRAQCQSDIIYSMMSHVDAKLSFKIAAAAKKDSSAMKSLAIITMAFLPGTFFATLFSVPSMPDGIQNFGFYWALAIPSTVSVFLWRYRENLRRLNKHEPKSEQPQEQ